MPKLTITITGAVVLLLLIVAGILVANSHFATNGTSHEVIIFNHAKETITQGEVNALGKRYSFQRVAPSGSVTMAISARGEGGYVIEVLFQSGRKLLSNEFYLTGGFSIIDLINVQDHKIILERRNVK